MSDSTLTRRQFNKLLATGMVMGGLLADPRAKGKEVDSLATNTPGKLRVAAIQMVPKLGDVQANLTQAEQLVSQAIEKGAKWIMLPEMFTSAAAFHPDLLHSVQPIDGPPAQLMKQLSRKGNAVVGGSFLATRGQHVYNSFLLTFPDGTTLQHDKDYPTYWENCFCKGGKDDGVLNTPIGPVGSALCWEIIRSKTAQRLMGKVKLVVGGSCWWTLPDDADPASPLRAVNLRMLQESGPHFARLLGVPVVHGSHAGRFHGFYSPDLPDVAYDSMYLGEALIVDAGEYLPVAHRTKAKVSLSQR